ncbi:MAG: Mth938-like domain-containing protein [Rhabdaerophilum sp.]
MPVSGFAPGRHPIEGYGAQGFRFAGMAHPGSILALPSGIRAWDVRSLSDICAQNLAPLISERETIEILLIGTGKRAALPIEPFLEDLRAEGFRPELMDTPAAARTYNVLLAENRRVAAALLAF